MAVRVHGASPVRGVQSRPGSMCRVACNGSELRTRVPWRHCAGYRRVRNDPPRIDGIDRDGRSRGRDSQAQAQPQVMARIPSR